MVQPVVHDVGWVRLLAGTLIVGVLGVAEAFTLTEPTEQALLRSGARVAVSVQVGTDVNIRAIRYYWYRLDEEPVDAHQTLPAPFRTADGDAPLSGYVEVPTEANGAMRLLAIGELTRGRLGTAEDFDEVIVQVRPDAPLGAIEFSVQRPWRFDTIGKRMSVPVVGQYDDGVSRPLTGPSSGSRFTSSDDAVVTVDEGGILTVTGNGRAQVTVENQGKIGTIQVVVNGDPSPNRPPIAAVERELQVRSDHLVVLDGLGSRDPDGDPLRYEWRQLRGPRVALSSVDEAKATFMAPKVTERKLFQFSLTVIDMAGPDRVKGAESAPAVISVWVSP
ncbi:conserved protein of unknown function [Nitrospira japonica]|uniref:BIG2 domain-containing protein n=1 Tax=Nitrospira japonica TaxID=1325564 RepID=A0A1W1I6L0_9BACT|nr:hypothetical protein [Nitrospira japonica]SLM48646.1 conserved protein of unknown function [Nitrospira japonica]